MHASRWIRVFAALLVLPLLSTLAAPSSAPDAEASTRVLCGGRATVVSAGRVWTCAFDDEFTGTSVNPHRWAPLTTQVSSWTTADTCYVDRPANVFVRYGRLHLVARREKRRLTCRAGGRATYSTRHTGGGLMSLGKFSQTYGRFDFRAKFPATRLPGFWADLWLYPVKQTYGAWPASGEIDVAEHWTGHGDHVYPALHYTGSGSRDTATNCTIADASRFHSFRLEWRPSSLRFYYDGRLCFSKPWPTFLGRAHLPFNRPFYLILSEGFGDFSDGVSPRLPASGPVVVDWVRVYR